MKCIRCGQDIEADAPADVVICGSCADDLRAEGDAMVGAAEVEAEAMNKEAYEEAQYDKQYDSGNGYRYI